MLEIIVCSNVDKKEVWEFFNKIDYFLEDDLIGIDILYLEDEKISFGSLEWFAETYLHIKKENKNSHLYNFNEFKKYYEDVKEMTLEEIEEKLGYKIKIVE